LQFQIFKPAYSVTMKSCILSFAGTKRFIIEIQELRHKSQPNGDNADASTTSVIDQQLMSLDERLETVEKGIKTTNETLEPLLRTAATPTVAENGAGSYNADLLRKHAALLAEWETVQDESGTLREELKEDKWLTVFRTVTDQADGMMSSLEKAVNRCQVRKSNSLFRGINNPLNLIRILYGKLNNGVLTTSSLMLLYRRLDMTGQSLLLKCTPRFSTRMKPRRSKFQYDDSPKPIINSSQTLHARDVESPCDHRQRCP